MNNKTKFEDAEIMEVKDRVEKECVNNPLSERQILNIAAIVDNYKYESSEDRLLALKYASIIRADMQFYLKCTVKPGEYENYRNQPYLDIESIVKMVIIIIYPDRKFDIRKIHDKALEGRIEGILNDLRLEMYDRRNAKKKALTDKKEELQAQKQILEATKQKVYTKKRTLKYKRKDK